MITGKFNRIQNYIMGFILLTLWVSILIIHGIAGAVAWALVKLYISPMGVILVLVNLTLLIISFVRRTKVAPKAITLIFSIFLAVPIFMLFNICRLDILPILMK